jgi:hypothetical protein
MSALIEHYSEQHNFDMPDLFCLFDFLVLLYLLCLLFDPYFVFSPAFLSA